MFFISRVIFLFILLPATALAWNTPFGSGSGNKFTQWTWTGAGGNTNFSNPANWCGAYVNGVCRGATTAPTSTSSVVFNDVCQAYSNCSPTLTASLSIGYLTMASNYTGTLNTATYNLTVRRGANLVAGTITNGSGTLSIGSLSTAAAGDTLTMHPGFVINGGSGMVSFGQNSSGSMTYNILGGTVNASTSITRFQGPVIDVTNLNFVHNNATLQIQNSKSTILGFENLNIYNLHIIPSSTMTFPVGTTITVNNNLTIEGASSLLGSLRNATILVPNGNVYHTGYRVIGDTKIKLTGAAQFIDATGIVSAAEAQFPAIVFDSVSAVGTLLLKGSIAAAGGFTNTALGTVSLDTGAELSFISNSIAANYDFNSTTVFPSLTLNTVTNLASFGNVYTQNLSIIGTPSTCPTLGLIHVTGNVTSTGQICGPWQIVMEGTGAQTYDVSGSTNKWIPGVRINKASGAFSFIGDPVLYHGHFQHVAGTVTMPTNFGMYRTLTTASLTPTITSNSGITFNHLRINNTTSNGEMRFNDLGTVSGNLYFDTVGNQSLLTGSIDVAGDIIPATNSQGMMGTSGVIKLNGVNQNINFTNCASSTCSLPGLNIASSGNVTLTGILRLYASLTHTSGTVDATASTINMVNTSSGNIAPGTMQFNHVTFSGNNLSVNGAVMRINGTFTAIGSSSGRTINTSAGGAIDAYGDVAYITNGYSGNAVLTFKGNNSNYTHTATAFPTNTIVVAKNAGQFVILTSNITSTTSYSVTSGSINLNGYNLTIPVGKTLTLAAGTTVKLSGGTLSVNGSNVPAGAYSGGTVVP